MSKNSTSTYSEPLTNQDLDVELGIHSLENNLKEIVFPKCQGKIRTTYSMGNGKIVTDANNATKLYIEREFPEISSCYNKPHSPIFVPDAFIFNSVKPKVMNN